MALTFQTVKAVKDQSFAVRVYRHPRMDDLQTASKVPNYFKATEYMVTIVSLEMDAMRSYNGITADGQRVSIGGGATKMWIEV